MDRLVGPQAWVGCAPLSRNNVYFLAINTPMME